MPYPIRASRGTTGDGPRACCWRLPGVARVSLARQPDYRRIGASQHMPRPSTAGLAREWVCVLHRSLADHAQRQPAALHTLQRTA
eukprot:scaffold113131_cov72-Phaeocystis_antarctica.AAC.1